jgi:uncharacterized phage infection (PIP) family protein YhgE
MGRNTKKSTTIDDLAAAMEAGFTKIDEKLTKGNKNHESLVRMVAKGFKDVKEDDESLARMVAKGFENTAKDMAELKQGTSELKHEVSAVKNNVNNYLELSEKRYVELKQRDILLAKWLKLVAEKTGVSIDVSQLEEI